MVGVAGRALTFAQLRSRAVTNSQRAVVAGGGGKGCGCCWWVVAKDGGEDF